MSIRLNVTVSKWAIRPLTKEKCKTLSGALSKLDKNITLSNITVETLAKYINDGHSIMPAIFGKYNLNSKGQYTRSKANFYSLDSLFLDIDNSIKKYYKDIDGKTKQETINFKIGDPRHVSIEQAKKTLKEFGLDYFILYTTLSHKEEEQHKYRIGFMLKETVFDIDTADKLYRDLCYTLSPLGIKVDTATLECSRIFFPGTVIETNNNAYLDITKLKEYVPEPKNTGSTSRKITTCTKKTYEEKEIEKEDIINYINEQVQEIHEIDFSNRYDEINEILDLTEILGVEQYEKFRCILHEDHDPSAYIYDNGDCTVYHCFGCEERLNGVQLIKKLFDLDELSFIRFLEDNTQIRIGTEYQKQSIQIATSNTHYILDEKGLERDNETVYKYLKKRNLFLMLETLYSLGSLKATLQPLGQHENGITFFYALSRLETFYNKRYGTSLIQTSIRTKINTLANLGFIKKLDLKELNDKVQKNCKEWMKNNNRLRYPNFFYLPPLTLNLLKNAENIINIEKEIGVKARNACKKQAIIVQEVERANEIYVQNRRKYNIESEKLYKDTVAYINSLEKTHFEIEEVVKNIDKNRNYRKDYKTRQVEIYMTKLTKEGIVKRVKCSKLNRKEYNIPDTYTHYQYVYVIL